MRIIDVRIEDQGNGVVSVVAFLSGENPIPSVIQGMHDTTEEAVTEKILNAIEHAVTEDVAQ